MRAIFKNIAGLSFVTVSLCFAQPAHLIEAAKLGDSFAQLHFFEHVKYGDYQYGSSKEGLERAWAKNDLVSLIVDIKGARSYLEALGDQVYFLYVTCSLDTLAQRMADRGDASDQIKKRLAGSELNELPEDLASCAHVLVNDDLQATYASLDSLVRKLQN